MSLVEASDVDLVTASRGGDREAFGEIVSRYQSLVCSVAYSATGSLCLSEDVAQETFFAAWKQLAQLNEPAKLRSWLCGIARNLVNNSLRRQGREPAHAAEPLDALSDTAAPEPQPLAQTISKEEEAILWRSLGQIPETYREPLILFYREHQSVESVAQKLELSEDAVKQRLSRGRKLLQERVAAFVEGALARTTPGKAFTVAVIAGLPAVFATSASAATLGATAAKSASTAKSATLLGVLGVLIGPILGVAGAWLGVKASIASAESVREREFIVRRSKGMVAMIVFYLLALCGVVRYVGKTGDGPSSAVLITSLTFVYVASLLIWIIQFNRNQRRIRLEEAAAGRDVFANQGVLHWQTYEHRSRQTFLGLPLLHVRNGRARGEKLRPAVGWIAIGDCAIGLIACGGLSIGAISIGGVALGLAGFGGVALGVLAAGGFALGGWACGGMAVGYLAYGGCAVAWHAAVGGIAMAHQFAIGGSAHAAEANTALARAAVEQLAFFKQSSIAMDRGGWLHWLAWLPMGLIIWRICRARRTLTSKSADTKQSP